MSNPVNLSIVPQHSQTECEASMLRDAHDCVTQAGEPDGKHPALIGYVIMAFYADGSTNMHYWRPNSAEHKIGNTMFEAWARASLERQLTYATAVRAADATIEERLFDV